jgi:hypothetical protein
LKEQGIFVFFEGENLYVCPKGPQSSQIFPMIKHQMERAAQHWTNPFDSVQDDP